MQQDDSGKVASGGGVSQARYWRKVVIWTMLGVLGWLLVTWVVTWYAGVFNQWTVAGAPAGYWLAAQGAIGAYLIIIVVHGRIMDGLDRRQYDALDAADVADAASALARPVDTTLSSPAARTHD